MVDGTSNAYRYPHICRPQAACRYSESYTQLLNSQYLCEARNDPGERAKDKRRMVVPNRKVTRRPPG